MTDQEKYLLLKAISDQIDKFKWHIENSRQYYLTRHRILCPPYEWKRYPLCNTYYQNNREWFEHPHPCSKCINYIFWFDIDSCDPSEYPIEEAIGNEYLIIGGYPCLFRKTCHIKLKLADFREKTNRPLLNLEAAKDFYIATLEVIKKTSPDKLIFNSNSEFGNSIIKVDDIIFQKYKNIYSELIKIKNSLNRLMKETEL
jgi:hypothetical protein